MSMRILGEAHKEAVDSNLYEFSSVRGVAGTQEYAQRGARGLRAFARKHKAYLQARLLKDVRKGIHVDVASFNCA